MAGRSGVWYPACLLLLCAAPWTGAAAPGAQAVTPSAYWMLSEVPFYATSPSGVVHLFTEASWHIAG